MAPRKRSAAASSSSSTSSKKPNPSQPSRYGIQHFFERHSQSQATAAPSNPDPLPNAPSIADRLPPPVAAVAEADEVLSQASPEISRNISSKRFKFSPGMLIKQSQDDGGDEITWKISPVNERLRSLASKQLPGAANIFQENSSAQVLPLLKPCSDKQDFSCSVKKLQKCVSSSTTMVSEISSTSSTMASVADQIIYCYNASNGDTKSDTNPKNFKSPFRTPPSLPYESKEAIDGVACNGEPEVLDHRQYRKTLLELLDQVEDVITDETMLDKPRIYSRRDLVDAKPQSENETHPLGQRLINPPSTHVPLDCNSFLVLEVSEKHESSNSLCSQSPVKILRLLNDRNGQERILYLCDEWFYSLIGPGDTVSTVGDFDDEGKCIVDHAKNLVIVHPEILLSGTRVASSFTCPRRAVLDERLKSSEHSSVALTGTMLHQLFQAGLLKELPSREFLEEYATIVIQRNIENLYACGDNEKDIYSKLIDAIPMILNWLKCFKQGEENNGGTVDFGHPDGSKAVSISEVIDIEEMAWAPRYGLKGVIDASVRVNIGSSVTAQHETIMPLEFKTGKGTSGQSAMEHSAQVILYTLLMSERYSKSDIDSGLLYYLRTNQTRGIKVQRSDLIGLIMRRNELATDILKASKTQNLPPMLQNLAMCKSCRHLNFCAIYHKASGGNSESSGLGCLFTDLVGHLNAPHTKFLKHWDSLIDLEAKVSKVNKKEMLDPSRIKGEDSHRSTLSFVLDVKSGFPVGDFSGNGRYIYSFVQHEPHGQSDFSEHESSNLNCSLKCGDYVILSTESGRVPVASGIVCDISQSHLSVSLSRRLRLPGTGPSSVTGNLVQQVWKISKDEVSSSFAIMRFNLIQLFTESLHGTHLRRMIIDLKPPRFDSRGILSQDPAISYIRAQKHLNSDQMRSIQKILAAKDYTLILGMPGTGKTSTMVHAVKALLMRGASILLTSYTNSAIDNLLIKLKLQGVDFVRIGRQEAVHSDIHDHCFGGHTHSVDDIKARMDHVRVVGVTCLGINHPLLANKKFDICIMDEAGQTTLPVSLGPLMLASTFVLVGDHYQLPPLVQSTEARENGMSVSLFCRLSEAHPQAISALQCQYRMCAGIMELSNALIYGNRLRCGSPDIADAKLKFSSMEPITSWQKEILDPNRAVIFVDTDQLPFKEEKDHKSVTNPLEAQIISVVAMELVKKGINGDDIGIITPYNSQANLIRQVLPVSVEVQTIDKYQGRDKDCILVSFVRSVEDSRTCNSSLLGDWHRINVAITRAKKKIIMIGSCKTLSTVPLLKLLIEKVNEQNGIVHISKNEFSHMESDKCFYDRRK